MVRRIYALIILLFLFALPLIAAIGWNTSTTIMMSSTTAEEYHTGYATSTTISLSSMEDDVTPITLGSFTASYPDNQPYLHWVTYTECNNQGWNIYRSNEQDFCSAKMLNSELITAIGTSCEPTSYSFVDLYEIEPGKTYFYYLQSVNVNGETKLHGPVSLLIPIDTEDDTPIFDRYGLLSCYPNPFNPQTSINFAIRNPEDITLEIYNLKGQKIIELYNGYLDESKVNKINSIIWNGNNESNEKVSSGVYMVILRYGELIDCQKLLLMK